MVRWPPALAKLRVIGEACGRRRVQARIRISMDFSPEDRPVDLARLTTVDPDAFASALQGGSFEYLPVPGRPFDATLRILRVGDLVVQHAEDGAHVTRAAMTPGLRALMLPLRYGDDVVRVNGAKVAATEAVLLRGGQEFHAAAPGALRWGAVAVPEAMLEAWSEVAAPVLGRAAGPGILAVPASVTTRIAAAIEAAAGMVDDLPPVLLRPGVAAGLALSLRDGIAAMLSREARVRTPPRATAEMVRVVRSGEEFLHANLARPIYRDELCAAVGVSRRKLHDAFVGTVGMSPHAYLKVRRLVLARRVLQAGGGGAALVKSVALSHGFWHLGYFAQDYKAMFGELPSRTLDAAQGDDVVTPGRAA
jgi:AraC-like DNA-binding protein